MRNLMILQVVLLCTGCALQPFEIQKAPLKPDQAVVFDIDGTLTPKILAIYIVRDDAANAVRLYADKGYKIIYLSARPQPFQTGIPDWLKKNHFPEGSIHVSETAKDTSDPEAFKKRILGEYKEKGWKFVAAYGDSPTDFEAYKDVGIQKDRIFALLREGDDKCQSDESKWSECLHSWTEHMDKIAKITEP